MSARIPASERWMISSATGRSESRPKAVGQGLEGPRARPSRHHLGPDVTDHLLGEADIAPEDGQEVLVGRPAS